MTRLKLLITILNEGYEKQMKKIYKKNNISVKLVTKGSGTASSSLLKYFGLDEIKKQIHLALIPNYLEENILNQIKKDLKFENPGSGIAFCISLTSANKYLLNGFDTQKEETQLEKINYHLIITIVLEDYLEQAMAAAKRVGAPGGTVIRGRGLGNEDAVKLFGFEIEPGREIILNVVDSEIKTKVMEEITNTVGIKTPGRGICISLPVDSVVGIEKIRL